MQIFISCKHNLDISSSVNAKNTTPNVFNLFLQVTPLSSCIKASWLTGERSGLTAC